MAAKIELPKHDGTVVDYSLWYSSVYDLSLQLIVDLYEYQSSLGDKVRFTPRIVTFNCKDCPKEIKKKDCYGDGQYCFLPPKSTHGGNMFKEEKVEGRPFLKMSLREKCVFEIADKQQREKTEGKTGGDKIWFNYMFNMYEDCLTGEKPIAEIDSCTVKALWEVGLDVQKVEHCMKHSFVDQKRKDFYQSDNRILRADTEEAIKEGLVLHPAVTINGAIFRGPMTGPDILRAICSAFRTKQDRPEYCMRDIDLSLRMGITLDISKLELSKLTNLHLLLGAIFVILLNLCLFTVIRRCSKRTMQAEVQTQV